MHVDNDRAIFQIHQKGKKERKDCSKLSSKFFAINSCKQKLIFCIIFTIEHLRTETKCLCTNAALFCYTCISFCFGNCDANMMSDCILHDLTSRLREFLFVIGF